MDNYEIPFIWVQIKDEYGNYDLIDGQTGEIIFKSVCGWFCDMVFNWLESKKEVYVRQFA